MAELKKYLGQEALSALVDQVKAEDAKALKAAKDYADGLATNYDGAGSAATAKAEAIAAAEEKVKALADGQVATNTADIAKLNGDASTEGSVAKAVADAKSELQGKIDAVDGIVDKNAEDIAAINDESTGILAQAKEYADDEDAKIEQEVAELKEYVGTIPEGVTATDIVGYIQEKTSGIASEGAMTELTGRVSAVEGEIATIKGDYLKSSDKTELKGKISVAQAAADKAQGEIDALEETYATDKAALEAADAGQVERIVALENQIGGVTGAMHFKGVKDAVPEDKTDYVSGDTIIVGNKEYVFDGTDFKEFGDASVNADLIAGLTGRVDTVEDDIDAAEGRLDAVEGAVATKVEQSAYDAKIGELAGADSAMAGRLDAIEAQLGEGEGSVAEQIEEAKQAAISAAGTAADTKDAEILKQAKEYADTKDAKIESRVDALESASATHALKSEVEAVAGRVTTAEGEIDVLQSEIDAVEAKAAANETAIATANTEIAKKAAQADLEAAIARIAANESAISGLEEDLADKADKTDLNAAVERIAANEGAIAANTSAINSFSAFTASEVEAMFA